MEYVPYCTHLSNTCVGVFESNEISVSSVSTSLCDKLYIFMSPIFLEFLGVG